MAITETGILCQRTILNGLISSANIITNSIINIIKHASSSDADDPVNKLTTLLSELDIAVHVEVIKTYIEEMHTNSNITNTTLLATKYLQDVLINIQCQLTEIEEDVRKQNEMSTLTIWWYGCPIDINMRETFLKRLSLLLEKRFTLLLQTLHSKVSTI